MNFIKFISNTIYNYFIPPHDNDFYYLSLLKNDNIEAGYSIHGLWSNYGDGGYPTFCKHVDFEMDKLHSIKDELAKYWPSKFTSAKHFYEHEYKKHGSCMFIEMTELEYFDKTIKLYHYVINNNLYQKFITKNGCKIPFDLNFIIINK